MFCPICNCEFRSGFTRCEGCDTDLVEELASVDEPSAAPAEPVPAAFIPMADYCGFLDLDEARQARDVLRRERIVSDILIREGPETSPDGPIQEEYWLRVEAARFRMAAPILGFDQAEQGVDDTETSTCSKCGYQFAAQEQFCPGCGTRFEPE
jgi:hypothetical protein